MESSESQIGHGAVVRRHLLRCGVVAGPLYLAVGLIQARVRDGFDAAEYREQPPQ